MARLTISGQEASNKRDLVVSAARRLFAGRGIAATSMRQIAKAVGVTDATLYHYFSSKDALVEATFQSVSFRVEDLDFAYEGAAGSLRSRLLAVGEAFLAVLAHDREWTRLVVRESLSGPDQATGRDLGSLLNAVGRGRIESLTRALQRDVATGLLRKCDEELVASQFFYACIGFWISEALIADEEPAPERRTAYLEYTIDLIASRLALPAREIEEPS